MFSQTQGLLGTLDQDVTNDFTAPHGDVIPADSSEDRVYLDFSLKCTLLFFSFSFLLFLCPILREGQSGNKQISLNRMTRHCMFERNFVSMKVNEPRRQEVECRFLLGNQTCKATF